MKPHILGITLLIALLFVSCKKDKDDPMVIRTDGLEILIQDEYTTPPAKVSVFFKVQKKDGTPVAGLLDSDFSIYEKGRNDDVERLISSDEGERQISPRAQLFAYNTLLILDLSGSVTNNNLPELKEASKQFIRAIIPEGDDNAIKISVRWFDGENVLHKLTDFSGDVTTLNAAIDGITADISSDNSTDLFGAVIKGVDVVSEALYENDDRITAASIVVFTDGTDQAARHTREQAYESVDGAKDQMTFYTIGLGSEIDESVLSRIGVNSFEFASNTEKLIETFDRIAGRVSDDANSYYLFEYCSPKRNGVNELKLEAIQDNLKGSANTTFNAGGFSGGCSL